VSKDHNKIFFRWNKEGICNFLILSLVFSATLFILVSPSGGSQLQYLYLTLFMGFALAVWIGWYTSTARIIGLLFVGALIGFFTQYTAALTGLWVYGSKCNNIPLMAGVFIHALTAVAVFGLVYLFDRIIAFCSFSRITGWFNGILVVALFITLFKTIPRGYEEALSSHPGTLFYYTVLFAGAVTLSFCLRLGKLISIIIAAMIAAMIGEYAGGTQAHVWCWLPDLGAEPLAHRHFPPLFLNLALWPMAGILEYTLSSLIANGIIYVDRVQVRQRIEDGDERQPQAPKEPYIPQEERIENKYRDRDQVNESRMGLMIRFGRQSFLKTLRKSPENGELLVVIIGLLMAFLVVFEKEFYCFFPADFNAVDWVTAAVLSGLFLVGLIFASKPYWYRTLFFVIFSLVFGYGMSSAIWLAFNPVETIHQPPYFGNLFWGPLWALVFMVIYGAAYLFNRFMASIFPTDEEREDREAPNIYISITAVVLALIFGALFVIRPEFLISSEGLFSDPVTRKWGHNLSLFVLMFSITGIFCLWWFFSRIRWRRSLGHALCAVVIIMGMLLLVKEQWHIDLFTYHYEFYLSILALSLTYIFCYVVSAHLSGEYVAKGFRITYSRRPIVKEKNPLKVVFNTGPHTEGRHRQMKDGRLYTYPPKESGVNVTFAREDPNRDDQDLPIEATLNQALKGLWGYWHNPEVGNNLVHTFKEAVKGRKVFIKPNVVVPFGSPYTTDPKLVAAVIKACLDSGATKVCVGEIAISNITSRMSLIYTGLKRFWESLDESQDPEEKRVKVILLDEKPFRKVNLQGKGVVMEDFHMPESLLGEKTFYINMPKMKTHVQSSVTLGIKNSHGLVPEIDRGIYHQRISQKVVDITKVWVPDLTIIDGYDALEGIGPWPGDLVPLRALVLSNDVALADLVASQLMRKEPIPAVFPEERGSIDFSKKTVKSTWLGYEQGLGLVNPDRIKRTIGNNPVGIDPQDWNIFIKDRAIDFRPPDYQDEGLIRNIGARFNKEPDFTRSIIEFDRQKKQFVKWRPAREFLLPLKDQEPTKNWGPIKLVSDEWRYPDLGASVMFSGVFGLMKTIMESNLGRSLDVFEGYVIVYGPLRKPLVCEGAILFGDRAIETEYLVFAPRIYQLPGHGRPPNYYSDVFERLSHDVGGELMAFCTEAVTLSRGWYW